MKTQYKKVEDTIIVSVNGKLNFEGQEPLRQDLAKLTSPPQTDSSLKTDSCPKKIIFNLEKLEFVGSTGITSFIQTLKDLNDRVPTKPRYCNVKNEFRRVMKALDEENIFEFYDSEERARKSFDQ